MGAQEQGYVPFRRYYLQLSSVAVSFCIGIGILRIPVVQLPDNASQLGVMVLVQVTHQVHPDLRTVIAAQHRPVLDQRHFQSQSGSLNSRGDAGDPAADHHHIEGHELFCFRQVLEKFSTQ